MQQQINQFNAGQFIDGSPIQVPGRPFSYGVACYPEKHEEALNLDTDFHWFAQEVARGAAYGVTLLFYEKAACVRGVERARRAGIQVPIIPGIKPLTRLSQLTVIPKTFHCDLPEPLAHEALKCRTDEEIKALGMEWSIAQCKELIAHGVPSIHFYTMSAADSIARIARNIY